MPAPDCEEITFTREQFYEKVWSTPATKVAAELGISERTLYRKIKQYDL